MDEGSELITSMAIPRRIIQSHESEYTFGKTFASCRARLLGLHAGYEYRFFCASERREFIQARRPELLELYDFYPRNIQRADLFRVVAMYELGGFYLDLDVHLYQCLDGLCDSSLIFTEEWKMTRRDYERRHGFPAARPRDLIQIGNYAFAAEPRHWFMEQVIDEMLRRAESVNPSTTWTEDVFFSTGPDVLNAVYARHRKRLPSREVTVLKMSDHGLRWQFGNYGTHLMVGSWA